MDKQWIISQNYLTVDLVSLFFHIKNIPTFIIFFIMFMFTDFFISVIPSFSYFFIMSGLFPPTIMDKDKTIYKYIIIFVDRQIAKIQPRIEKLYFKFMNS